MAQDNEFNTSSLSEYQLRGIARAMIESIVERFGDKNGREMVIRATADEAAEMLAFEPKGAFSTGQNSKKLA